MSEFTDAMSEGLADALGQLGTTAFVIDGTTFHGDLDELGDQSYIIVQGGKEIVVASHLLCALPQFAGAIPTAGTRLKIGTALFVIGSVSKDSASVTFTLAHADAH